MAWRIPPKLHLARSRQSHQAADRAVSVDVSVPRRESGCDRDRRADEYRVGQCRHLRCRCCWPACQFEIALAQDARDVPGRGGKRDAGGNARRDRAAFQHRRRGRLERAELTGAGGRSRCPGPPATRCFWQRVVLKVCRVVRCEPVGLIAGGDETGDPGGTAREKIAGATAPTDLFSGKLTARLAKGFGFAVMNEPDSFDAFGVPSSLQYSTEIGGRSVGIFLFFSEGKTKPSIDRRKWLPCEP